jgi:uncharacterized protein DUF5691
MTTWAEVVAAALVGTDRRPAPGGAPGLLAAAAVHGLRSRAGVRAVPAGSLPVGSVPEPAPDEDAPLASPAASARLARLLGQFATLPAIGAAAAVLAEPGTDAWSTEVRLELVDEWLEAGRLVPGELLPPLLDLGRRHRRLRPALLAAGGQRARWVAAQRPEWRYLLGEADERELSEAWDLAPLGRRIGHLTAVRRRDRAEGRALLESTWDTERADDRAALLSTFGVGLSTADEDLLERALDDRRREVRGTALDLLVRLPGSRYAQRMTARARAYLRVGPLRVDVYPPSHCDASMQRDGVAVRPPAGTGQRAWWLEEVLARTPVVTWGEPATILDKAIAQEWAAVVRRGLGRAAATQGAGDWAAVLVDRLLPEAAAAQRPEDRLLLEALYEALPLSERADRAAAVLRTDPGRATAAGVERLLELCPRPWPPALAAAALFAIDHLIRAGTSTWRLTGLVTLAGTRLPVSTVDEVRALRERLVEDRPDGPRLAAADQLADVLRFRHEMHEELSSDPA